MSNNSNLHLVLIKGDDPTKAWAMFECFVKSTGGNDVNVNNDRDFFDQWKTLNLGDGVLFTRSAYGPAGVMTPKVVKITEQ